MKNKFLIVTALVLSLVAGYLAFTFRQEAEETHNTLSQKVDRDFQKLLKRTSSYIYGGEPVGYIIQFENGVKFYIAGDTGPSADMKILIGDYYKPDMAILPIGGFFTMGPIEAAFAASLVDAEVVMPYHYASYSILENNPNKFIEELKKQGVSSTPFVPKIGEETDIKGVKVIWLGHASVFFISPGGKRIAVDLSNLSGLWPSSYKDFSGFKDIDLILITHGHPDHNTISDLNLANEKYNPVIIASNELGTWLSENIDFPSSVFYTLNKGGRITKEEFAKVGQPQEKIGDVQIIVVPASHTSSVRPSE